MVLRGFKSAVSRRIFLEKYLGTTLKNIGTYSLDESVVSTHNCENMIGVSQIPLGITDSLKINGKEYYVPLATTEGALVASISRGCKAISLSGGADVVTMKVGATRGPVFKIKNLKEKKIIEDFLETNFGNIKKLVKKTSSHISLKKYDTNLVGHNFYVRFVFDTADAMGMNMVSIATQAITDFIEKKIKIKCVSLSGNFCVDKKASWQNFIQGRGFEVWAEVVLKKKILKEVLKTSAKNFYDVWLAKCMMGSTLSGSMGFNAQFANVIAAIFLATGQDPGHIVEGSLGITSAEIVGEDLYVSVYLPDIMLGTVGGGTSLATQKEALLILEKGKKSSGFHSEELAEVVGGAVLAGEISLLASLSEGSLVKAHRRLGRGEKI